MIDNEKHRRWIATLPCVISGKPEVQCIHIRRNGDGGMGMKPSDNRCLPLFHELHAFQHNIGELKFWYPYGGYERAVVLAKKLYEVTGDEKGAIALINQWRKLFSKQMLPEENIAAPEAAHKTESKMSLQETIKKHGECLETQKHIDCGPHPDTHSWDGEPIEFDGGRGWSRTCSKCGISAMSHGMRYGP